jgi:phospholipid/cholesterol/gamma-HCH transport system substrate-binding protein
MRANRTLEIGTGLFVLLGFVALFFLTTQLPSSGLKLSHAKGGFHVTAAFDNVGDLKTGSPVTMAGVRIGEVDGIRIDQRQYKAVVRMRIDPQYGQIPDDSDASIQTEGLLGGKYIGIGAGGSETYLKEGSQIQFTQSALVLENLINKLFASFAGKSNDSGGNSSGNSTDANAGKSDHGTSGADHTSAGQPAPKEKSK